MPANVEPSKCLPAYPRRASTQQKSSIYNPVQASELGSPGLLEHFCVCSNSDNKAGPTAHRSVGRPSLGRPRLQNPKRMRMPMPAKPTQMIYNSGRENQPYSRSPIAETKLHATTHQTPLINRTIPDPKQVQPRTPRSRAARSDTTGWSAPRQTSLIFSALAHASRACAASACQHALAAVCTRSAA